MHVLFVHQNFPAQFGHIALYLVQRKGWRCSFVSQHPSGEVAGIECIHYQLQGGATEKNHYCTRSFENAIWHSHAVYEALAACSDLRPDLVVAHSGFLSTVFLRELYDCPIVNYFEYYYRTVGADMDYRPEFPSPAINCLRARARNANILPGPDFNPSLKRKQGLFAPDFNPSLKRKRRRFAYASGSERHNSDPP